MERDYQIDVLRAVGITLVIAGHSGSPLTGWIYSFHMPLFFFVSGYLRYGKATCSWPLFLMRKLRASIVPYVVFWAISMILYRNVECLLDSRHFAQAIGINEIKGLLLGGRWLADYSNNFPLWYLQLFFIAVVIFEVMVRYFKPALLWLVSLLLVLVSKPVQELLPGRPVFHINVLPVALVFMLIGYAFHWLIGIRNRDKRLGFDYSVVGLLIVIGLLIALKNGGNISRINSYWYIPGAACTTIGLYILGKFATHSRTLLVVGSSTLYILGFHKLCLRSSSIATSYIAQSAGLTNPLIENAITVAITLVLCCGIATLYKTAVHFVGHCTSGYLPHPTR